MTSQRASVFVALSLLLAVPATTAQDNPASAILRDSGVQGGIVVVIGCDAPGLLAGLRPNERYTVHGIDSDPVKVSAARAFLCDKGLYGPVSVEQLTGDSLPYADNLINLVVVGGRGNVKRDDEIMRVLVPGGVAMIAGKGNEQLLSRFKLQVSLAGSGFAKIAKAFPDDIDDWSHFLHDAGNNAVAKDTRVGVPRSLQWVAPPLWLRSHETPSGVQAQVAAGGRLFYIFDEGLVGITDERLPDRWSIVCRDAFNGCLLWRREMADWGWRAWARSKLEGKDWTTIRALRTNVPAENQRRVVADERHVYVTLSHRAPMSIVDAATGDVRFTIKETEPTAEILVSNGVAVAHVRKEGDKPQSSLVAVSGDTGSVLWEKNTGGMIRPLATAIDAGRVVYQVGQDLVCLDLKTGDETWRVRPKTRNGKNLVAANDVVLILGGGSLDSYNGPDGKLLWSRKVPPRSGFESSDLFVVGDTVWPGMIPVDEQLKARGKSDRALALGFDIRTGEERKRVAVGNFRSPEHHHRCYRNKATSRFIISGMEGAEFLDLDGDSHSQNNWLRGACKEGIMPCYGLLYVPADQCFCQPGGKLLGYTAVAAAPDPPVVPVPDNARLLKGPAYGGGMVEEARAPSDSWPTFRFDAGRSGGTPAAVGANLAPAWRVNVGTKLTQPVVDNGRVFVADVTSHTVHALDLGTGNELWRFAAAGRVDSPPTLHKGLVLFGSRDGYVYCLRESDGALCWRFLAAPADRRIAAFDQIESVWPVHGSVLVRDGVAYVAAGRSTYLDGGIRFYALDPVTGSTLHTGLLEGPHRDVAKERDVAFYIPGANSDVLVSEGDAIYMRQKRLTLELAEVPTKVLSSKGEADVGTHVFSTAGLLDDSGYNRTFWMYSKRWPGFQLANQSPKSGQLLVHDADATYAVKAFYRRNVHSPMFFPGKEGYLLFADKNTTEPQIVGEEGAREPLRWLPQSDYSRGRGQEVRTLNSKAFGQDKGIGYTRADPPLWTLWVPVRVQAMVKTRDTLFVAGPPDVWDAKEPFAAFEGGKGGVVVAVSANDGAKIAQTNLDSPPVFDGLIAVDGKLLISLMDGTLVSLADQSDRSE